MPEINQVTWDATIIKFKLYTYSSFNVLGLYLGNSLIVTSLVSDTAGVSLGGPGQNDNEIVI